MVLPKMSFHFLHKQNGNASNGHKKRSNSFANGHSGPPFKHPRLGSQGSSSNLSKADLWEQRANLPIASARLKLLEEIKRHRTVILLGETGSGKTTQVPQFIHEEKLDALGAIAVTQPRRMAAISISNRVSEEMNCVIGSKVGYKVRFEDMTSPGSKIIFLTDGMLLREAMLDPLLIKYSWIILDEAHERTISTDILFGIVKTAQIKREEQKMTRLKVIVMSATLEAEKFSNFFRNAPILYVSGRQFPVNVRHVSDHQDNWQDATLKTIFQIHQEAPDRHDILVFLTGQEEIESFVRQIRTIAKELEGPKMFAIPLYASQSPQIQQKVFTPTKSGFRKVILATNIAETSLTIPGIRYVIDSCRVKAKLHLASTGMDMLKVVKISKAQGWQRTGRAGRENEGHCYRMLTSKEFNDLPGSTTPEILRCNLATVLLQMLAMNITDLKSFPFLERPPQEAIEAAIRLLRLLGAVNPGVEPGLSDLGKKMAPFPLDPKFTKTLFIAESLGCLEDIITIVAILSGESILVTPSLKREEAVAARQKFVCSEGDLITNLKIYRAFNAASKQDEWCKEHYIHFKHISFAKKIRSQLIKLCEAEGMKLQSSGNNFENVRKALAQGLFTNVARLNQEGQYITIDSKQVVKIHPSSVMFQKKPEIVVYTELISTQTSYIRDLTLVDAKWLLESQPEYFRQHRIFK